MKRFHVHVGVADLDASIRFYSTLFGASPSVRKDDYAKWMLDDPRVNFAISRRASTIGLNHLGIQVDAHDELEAVHARLEAANRSIVAEHDVACCYARSNKYWVTDPAGIAWESFHTLASIPMWGDGDERDDACCSQPRDDAAKAPRVEEPSCCGSSMDAAKMPRVEEASCCGGTTDAAKASRVEEASCCGGTTDAAKASRVQEASCCGATAAAPLEGPAAVRCCA